MTVREQSDTERRPSLWAGPAACFGAMGLGSSIANGWRYLEGAPLREGSGLIILITAAVSAWMLWWGVSQTSRLWRR